MKITSVELYARQSSATNFKGYDNENEYVYIPLVWNSPKDTYTPSGKEMPPAQTPPKKKKGKLGKIFGTLAGVTVAPTAVAQAGDGIKSISGKVHEVTSQVKDDLSGSIQDIHDMKDELQGTKENLTNDTQNQNNDNNDDSVNNNNIHHDDSVNNDDKDNNNVDDDSDSDSDNDIDNDNDNDNDDDIDNDDDYSSGSEDLTYGGF